MTANKPQNNEKPSLNLSQALALLSVIVVPLLVWGVSVETRFSSSIYRIEQNEKFNIKTEEKIDKILDGNTKILVELERLKK